MAEDNPFADNPEGVPDKAEAISQKLKVSGKACEKLLQKYRTNGADYTPGVDVRGNPVVGADLNGAAQKFNFPKEIEFDLTLNLFEQAGLATLADLFPDGTTSLGKVKYNVVSGRLTVDGKPLVEGQEKALSAACQQYEKLKSEIDTAS